MDHPTALALLDDYVDGELAPEASQTLEAHLDSCADCRTALDELRELLALAAELPAEIEPERDLWCGIAPQLEAHTAPDKVTVLRPWYTQPRALTLAAALLIGATALVTAELHQPDTAPQLAQDQAEQAPQHAPFPAWEREMTTASTTLAHAFDARRAELQPATLIIIDENLAIIDRAIEDCRQALERDPANTRVEDALLQAWQHKVDLLETATGLPDNS